MTRGGTIDSERILLRQTILLVASVPGATHRRRRPGANSGTSFPPGMVPMREPGRSNVCVPPETEGTKITRTPPALHPAAMDGGPSTQARRRSASAREGKFIHYILT